MVYVWAFLALSLLVAVILLAVALSKKNSLVSHLQVTLASRNSDLQRTYSRAEQTQVAYTESVSTTRTLAQKLRDSVEARQALLDEKEDLERQFRERTAQASSISSRAESLDKEIGEARQLVATCRAKYGSIMDIETEVARLKEEARGLDAKRRELRQIEGDLMMADVGLYRPQYDWKDSARYKLALDELYRRHKQFVKDKKATVNVGRWVITGVASEDARLRNDISKLALRAFNAECEAAVANVRWNNFKKMQRRIEKAHEQINKLTSSWFVSISQEYLALWIEELVLTHEHKEQIEEEKAEQRRINEQIREEERAQRELDKARERAEAEEERARQALDRARAELETARASDAVRYSTRIAELEAALLEAHEKTERAISRAQLTKAGHVYIISNVGSFGENVYKVGMTRREDPIDRVRELGDASVPFFFDVHGIIYSDNAPKLEADLHSLLASHRINLVNQRKEFFRAPIQEIVKACNKLGLDAELTLMAEAKEYRQSTAMRRESLASSGKAIVSRSS